VQRIGEIGRISRESEIPLLVDAAQSAGHVPIDVQAMGIDLLAVPGHKGLLGPLGTGALYVRPGLEQQIVPLRHGGTGSISEMDVQPEFMPDKFEAGSHNAIGIAGLLAGVNWILKKTVKALFEHDQMLCRTFMEELEGVEGIQYLGPKGVRNRIGMFSMRVADRDPMKLAEELEREYGILTRAGLHCAPLAHRHLGTLHTNGAMRLSFGPFVTVSDVTYAADALAKIAMDALLPAAKG
jgi:selenocysteine lyase/cysteine desulfurase